MGNNMGQQIYDILKEELPEITAGIIVKEKCKKVGRTVDTIMLEDLKNLIPLILGPVLLLGGNKKAEKIKEKLERLVTSNPL